MEIQINTLSILITIVKIYGIGLKKYIVLLSKHQLDKFQFDEQEQDLRILLFLCPKQGNSEIYFKSPVKCERQKFFKIFFQKGSALRCLFLP